MLNIIQDYKELLNAKRITKQKKKDLEEHSNRMCPDALYKLSDQDLYISEGAYSLGADKLTCKNVQKYFGKDAARCEQCRFFSEFGITQEIKEAEFNKALQKQKEARNKLIADLCFYKKK